MTSNKASHTLNESALHPKFVDGWRSAGNRATQSSEQRNGRVPEMGHPWLRRDAAEKLGEKQGQDYKRQNGDVVSDAVKLESWFTICQNPPFREQLLLNS